MQRLHSNFSDFRQTRCCMATLQIFAVIGLWCKSQGINKDNKCQHSLRMLRSCSWTWAQHAQILMSIHVDACRCRVREFCQLQEELETAVGPVVCKFPRLNMFDVFEKLLAVLPCFRHLSAIFCVPCGSTFRTFRGPLFLWVRLRPLSCGSQRKWICRPSKPSRTRAFQIESTAELWTKSSVSYC